MTDLWDESANDLIAALKADRLDLTEVCALANAHAEAGVRKAAARVWKQKAPAALQATVKSTLKSGYRNQYDYKACERIRSLDAEAPASLDVPQLGRIMLGLGARGYGFVLEREPTFARSYVYELLDPKNRCLDLGGWHLAAHATEGIQLKQFPTAVFDELAGLRKKLAFESLGMHGCALTDLPPAFARLKFLKRINFNFNDFTHLPDVLFELDGLEELELYLVKLEELNPKIGQLRRLRKLSVARSKKLKELPVELFSLENLEVLNLFDSRIKALPPEIGNLKKLVELDLGSSRIKTLPEEIGQCTALEVIDLSNSALLQIPEAVAELPKLKRLRLNWVLRRSDDLPKLPRRVKTN